MQIRGGGVQVHFFEHIFEPAIRIYLVQPAGIKKGVDHCGALCCFMTACK